jgi:hypothetical protein
VLHEELHVRLELGVQLWVGMLREEAHAGILMLTEKRRAAAYPRLCAASASPATVTTQATAAATRARPRAIDLRDRSRLYIEKNNSRGRVLGRVDRGHRDPHQHRFMVVLRLAAAGIVLSLLPPQAADASAPAKVPIAAFTEWM